ncbi:MAG: AI-2E family transporter [Flavisolibacter sp.]|nr:AI-2E family transporter [Flavisolibacter sp.]
MPQSSTDSLYKTLVKAMLYAVGLIILLWFLYEAAGAVLLLLFALILALVINAPVALLEKRGLRRFWACLIVFGVIFIVIGLLAWLIIPKISEQVTTLVNNLPHYATQLSQNISSWFEDYPELSTGIQKQGITLSEWIPSVPKTLMQIGNYSLSLASSILIMILFFSMVIYAVSNPRPLLALYFSFFPVAQHDRAEKALYNTSTMLIGWIRANLIAGGIRAVCMTIFLSFMGVPGAWVWGTLAFFAELVPKLGFYIASIPPILVALSVSPATALWTTIFLLALDEILGDFVLPKIRSNTMNIHPVSILFVLLAMAAIFGFMGALLSVPLTAIIKAYYEAFFIERFKEDAQLDERIDTILFRTKGTKEK